MDIVLRLVCEILSRIAVKISFLWVSTHSVYAEASFSANVTSWCSRNDTQIFISVYLYMNIIFIAQWLFSGNFEILHCSDVFARRQQLCKPKRIFKLTRVNFLYRENMTSFLNYVTTTLRALTHLQISPNGAISTDASNGIQLNNCFNRHELKEPWDFQSTRRLQIDIVIKLK